MWRRRGAGSRKAWPARATTVQTPLAQKMGTPTRARIAVPAASAVGWRARGPFSGRFDKFFVLFLLVIPLLIVVLVPLVVFFLFVFPLLIRLVGQRFGIF